jgi:hypothetical protein
MRIQLNPRRLPEVKLNERYEVTGTGYEIVVITDEEEVDTTFYINTLNGIHCYKVELTNAPMFLINSTFQSIVEETLNN